MDSVGRADARLHVAVHRPRRVVAGRRSETVVVARVWRGPFDGARRRAAASTRCTGRPVRARGRFAQEEVVAALDAATGKTIWEHKYPSPTTGVDYTEGAGPHATPLIVGNRLFVVGSRREFFALDKNTGKMLWSHDFMKDTPRPSIDRGMANSPLLFNNTIIVAIGGKGQAVGAFNPETGALLWKAGNVEYSPASPILIGVDGQQQLVVFGGDRIAGMDPANGRALWSHPHRPTGASTSATRCGRHPITCCCSRRRTAPAAAPSSCARRAARPPSPSVGR